MASSIVLRTISAVDDKRISMSNSQFARGLAIGTNWNKIRIGLRISMTDTGANIAGSPVFAVGLCSGTTNIFGDASCDNFVGILPASGSVFQRQAGSSDPRYLTNPGSFVTARKVGSTLTRGTDIIKDAGEAVITCDVANKRVVFAVEIEKGSPNYTVNIFARANNAITDVSYSDFYATMATVGNCALVNHAYGTARTVACSEVAGSFNAVNISWDVVSPVIEISDLTITRLS